jgi:hypothetical protein
MKKKIFVNDSVALDMPFEECFSYSLDEFCNNFNNIKKYVESYIQEHKDCKDFNIFFDYSSYDGNLEPELNLRFKRPATPEEIKLQKEDAKEAKEKTEKYERDMYLKLKKKFDKK